MTDLRKIVADYQAALGIVPTDSTEKGSVASESGLDLEEALDEVMYFDLDIREAMQGYVVYESDLYDRESHLARRQHP